MISRRSLAPLFALILPFAVPADAVRAEDEAFLTDEIKPAPKASKKKPAKKKTYDYDRSKYKSREPSQTSTYKFDAKGEPVVEGKKKKSAPKKRAEPPEIGAGDAAEACGFAETCAEKKSEADAL